MTIRTSIELYHANNLITASNNLEIVMGLTTEGNWGMAIQRLCDEWGTLYKLLSSITPESIDEDLHKLVLRHADVALSTLGELDNDVLFRSDLEECIQRKKSASEFVQKLKPEILANYTVTKQELADTIKAFDAFVLTSQQKPALFVSKEYSAERELFSQMASVLMENSDLDFLNLSGAISGAKSDPSVAIPKLMNQYCYARKALIEKHELEVDSDFAEYEKGLDHVKALSSNKETILTAFEGADCLKSGLDEMPVIEVPYYSDISIHGANYKDIINSELTKIGLALGNNPLLKEEFDELKKDVKEASTLIESMIGDADYLYERRNELQSICEFSLEDVAVYSDANTDWYINYFDEGTENFDTAQRTAEECKHEADRLDHGVRVLNEVVCDIKRSTEKLSEKVHSLTEPARTQESSLSM